MVEKYKTRMWKGRLQAFITNPTTQKRGWYNIEEEHMTELGRSVQAAITSFDEMDEYYDAPSNFNYKWDADTKEARLRRNIKYVLETKIGNNKTMYLMMSSLQQAIVDKLSEMSDFEIINYSREYKKELGLFFEYETFLNSNDYAELDARTIKLLKGLGLEVEEFMDVWEVPLIVRDRLSKLNQLLNVRNEEFGDN